VYPKIRISLISSSWRYEMSSELMR
jgi:hypothetical protein